MARISNLIETLIFAVLNLLQGISERRFHGAMVLSSFHFVIRTIIFHDSHPPNWCEL